jgi:hypothetical protein
MPDPGRPDAALLAAVATERAIAAGLFAIGPEPLDREKLRAVIAEADADLAEQTAQASAILAATPSDQPTVETQERETVGFEGTTTPTPEPVSTTATTPS